MSRKIIDHKDINLFEKKVSRLSYDMIFNEGSENDQEEIDIDAILEENNRRWEKRLKREKEDAFLYGREEGFDLGLKKARKEIDEKLEVLREGLEAAHNEWKERQVMMEPGILDLVFEITDQVLGIPLECEQVREKLESELGPLLQKVDESSRPVLWVAEEDYSYVEKLQDEYAGHISLKVRVSKECNPGEFELETNRETVVHNFRKMLGDFKDSLSLPTWNEQ